jgi:hypothetical protein
LFGGCRKQADFGSKTAVQQSLLVQSVFALQDLPLAHAGQFGPPQSVSVSPLLVLPSEQLTHFLLSHTPLVQSVLVVHVAPSAQRPQAIVPPQPSLWFPHEPDGHLGVQHAFW